MKRLLPLFIIGLAGFIAANAQLDDPLAPKQTGNKFLIGPAAGLNLVSHSTDLQVTQTRGGGNPAEGLCESFTDGGNTGFFAGFTAEFIIGSVTNSNQSIITRVLYNTMPASFNVDMPEYPVALTSGGTTLSKANSSLELDYSMVTFEAQYKYNLFDGFGLVAGPTVDLIMAANETRLLQLTGDDSADFQFSDYDINNPEFIDPQTRNLDLDGVEEIDNASGTRFGLKFGVQYEWNVPQAGFLLVPSLNYNLGLTNVNDIDWTVSAVQIGVDVRFGI
jgi:hypothetical protein